MILVGNQRGGAYELAAHLLKQENERVEVHELRGFASTDLREALQESYAVSRATRCKQHLYSLSFNPPQEAEVSPEEFEEAIARAEERLGLQKQPRAIVFHEKRGADGMLRRHAHVVWCRIDTEHMRAVHLPHPKQKLKALSRDLYVEHGWKMPRGLVSHEARDPRNYSLAEWQQAKRAKRDPKVLKGQFQEAWAVSDSRAAFEAALLERGFFLARGDRRGHVAVDHSGEVYPVSRWTGQKVKAVKARLGGIEDLPSVDEARDKAAARVAARLEELKAEERQATEEKQQRLEAARAKAAQVHRQEAAALSSAQKSRETREEQAREARLRKGLRGLLDRLTGRRRRTLEQNKAEAAQAIDRDTQERAAQQARASEMQAAFKAKAAEREARRKAIFGELDQDIETLRTPASRAERKSGYESKRKPRTRAKPRARDGPELEP